MTEAELRLIESDLAIILPAPYRQAVLSFPIPAFRGNADTPIWDNAKRIIEENKELRAGSAGGVKPWPPNMFAMGHGGDGCPYALDLSLPGSVWWVEKRHLDSPNTYKLTVDLEAWLAKEFADLRQDLESDAVDPDGTPDERNLKQASYAREGFGCVITLLIIAVLVIITRLLGR